MQLSIFIVRLWGTEKIMAPNPVKCMFHGTAHKALYWGLNSMSGSDGNAGAILSVDDTG